MGILVYDSNNSGGSFWLKDKDWEALDEAGWNVHWGGRNYEDPMGPGIFVDWSKPKEKDREGKKGDRYMESLAVSCAKEFDSPEEGISEWERITGQSASAIGCTCCGPPHNFEFIEGEKRRHFSVHVPHNGTLEEW